ncbi:hypothetical protein D3C72_143530 [compost metagenome]
MQMRIVLILIHACIFSQSSDARLLQEAHSSGLTPKRQKRVHLIQDVRAFSSKASG